MAIAVLQLGAAPWLAVAAESEWITTGETGRLIYVPDAEGDRILDFSDVGYQGRGTALIPSNVPTVLTVSPVTGDDTTSIQNAIDQVSLLPIGPDGYRGTVQLTAGTFDIDSQLEIRASGVVLRGSGRDVGGTVLHGRNPLTGGSDPNQRPLVRVYGSGSRSNIGSTIGMIDKVVPAGSRSFRVSSTSTLSVGDTIRIERPSTQEWINAVGMDNPPNGDPPWTPGSMNVRYDRVVTRIEGDRIFVDAPLANSFDAQFGGGTLREYVWNGAIENIGIENLRGDTDFDSPTDEDHAWEFISIGGGQNDNRAQNVWIRNIAAEHFGDSVVVANPSAKWVTVDDAISQNPVSLITGSRRYTYDLSGELNLVTNAQADEGRHDFVTNSTRPAGPNVFHNSIATNANSDTGPHQRWSTGVLFDNITVQGNAINARNRGSFGTSHGWSGANIVVWNSTADSYRIQNPPTAQNWLVGSTGTIVEDTTFGPQPSGNYDSHGTQVTAGGSTSLYEAQFSDSEDIEQFRANAGGGNWNDASTWDQRVAPTDSFSVSLRDYLIGDVDDFVNDGSGSVDNAFIDPDWEAAINADSSNPITGFDDLAANQNVAFTIQHQLDAGEHVVHGFLALALLQNAGGQVDTDFIRLFNMNANSDNKKTFSELGWDTQINTSETFVGVLDLGSSLAELQDGSVNVQINDDTGVDWAIYTVTVATPRNDTSSTSVFIDGGATVTVDSAVAPVGELRVGPAGAGTLRIADTGVVDVDGDFIQAVAGDLEVEVSSAAAFGSLDVQATAVLAGDLDVSLIGLFEPSAGDSFEVLSAASVVGAFDSVTLPEIESDLAWLVDYQADSVEINVTFSADFDGDGDVDSSDLAELQSNYGLAAASQSQGDADGDGDVDGSDMLVWQRQFGSSVNFLSAVQVVPEPAAIGLTLAAMTTVLASRIRRMW
ncbi:MAG: hypothetical protein AAGD11_09375 [Planctomycetota bacterium]